MATFGLSYTLENSIGHVASKWFWRAAGTSLWTTVTTSGMTYSVALQADNTIFDFAIQNLNNDDNPTCATFQAIGFTDPDPEFSVSNNSISFEFEKPTDYITGYRATIALYSTPETVLQTIEIPSPADTVTGTFTSLVVATNYTIALLVAANEFDYTFNYNKITTNLSSCYPPSTASALLTSGTHMTIMWTAPVILPSNGFMGSYRKKGVSTSYLTFVTSGTTSGNTYSVNVSAPASYEGYIQSDCNDILSTPVPFGVNGYSPLNIITDINSGSYRLRLSSAYGNPYDTIVQGTIYYTVTSVPGSIDFDVQYLAGSTEATIILLTPPALSTVITSVVYSSIKGLFDNGGEIQQFDSVLTPDYFQFYNGLTSGTTWDGNPATLPSFTLDNFIPTEQDTEENITKGILNFSWIYDSVYMNGVSPYTFATLQFIDPGNSAVMGSTVISAIPIGARTGSISITKQISTIAPDTAFTMKLVWANGSPGSSLSFYLPEF